MIVLYSGTPGSGKSLKAAYDLIDRLKQGRDVIANFPIDMGYFRKCKRVGEFTYLDNQQLTVQALKDYAKEHHTLRREGQTLVIIDECASIFNCRSWNQGDRMEWMQLFQLHRKMGYDFILISQSDKLIDKQIRAFVEMEYKHRAVKHYKTFGWLLSLFSGGLFCQVEYWYGMHLRCGSRWFRLNKRKARIYDTYQIFE